MYMPTRVLVIVNVYANPCVGNSQCICQPVCWWCVRLKGNMGVGFLFQPGINQPVRWDCLGVSQPEIELVPKINPCHLVYIEVVIYHCRYAG